MAEAWDNAVDNGYEEELRAMSIEELALDMHMCDADIEKHLISAVEEELRKFFGEGSNRT